MWVQVRYFLFFMLINTLSYYLYNPTPPNMEQPWLYSTMVIGNMRILDDLSKLSDAIGYKNYHVFKQDAIYVLDQLVAYTVSGDDSVNITSAIFDSVPVRIYRSMQDDTSDSGSKRLAALVFLHGGGFMYGASASYDGLLRSLVKDVGIIVVGIDYRLAPQHSSPAAIEDCMRAARYVFMEAEALGVDAGRVGVVGDSAGGNLAAALTLSFRDIDGAPGFAYTALLYPWLQALDFNTPSMQQNEYYSLPDVTRRALAIFALNYINASLEHIGLLSSNRHIRPVSVAHYGQHIRVSSLPPTLIGTNYNPPDVEQVEEDVALLDIESAILDPLNFPLMAETMKNLPPTFVATMGFDTIRDDGFWFVQRLRNDGCNVKHYHDPLGWHGLVNMIGKVQFDAAQRLYDELLAYIRIFS